MATVQVNMKQMNRVKVTTDNVRWYDAIIRSNGRIDTLDARPYVEMLTEANVFFVASKGGAA